MILKYETIVIGLGAMGSATLYQLAKKGNKVLGIDQFSPPHSSGSSHGDTRITRLAIGKGEQYTPMAIRSHQLWKEMEKETGRKLLTPNGYLMISSYEKALGKQSEFFKNTVNTAEKYNIEHAILNSEDIGKRFPNIKVKEDEFGYLEKEGGFLNPEECIKAELELAEKYGAEIHKDEKVSEYIVGENITVKTNKAEYRADKLVITAGPWVTEFLDKEFSKHFKIMRQVLYWFDIKDSYTEYVPGRFPVFIWELQNKDQDIYGFPAVDGPDGGFKIATEQYFDTTTPATIDRNVTQGEIDHMFKNFVEPYFSGVTNKCIKALACMYTMTPDADFVIDFHPKHKNIVVASPCSGHGFKHSAAIGEAVAELVFVGKTQLDLSGFKLARFGSL